jgi:hypothetical protein
MRNELNRENPSQGEGTETTVIHEDITQWGNAEENDRHFLLKGSTLHGEIRHTHICWGNGSKMARCYQSGSNNAGDTHSTKESLVGETLLSTLLGNPILKSIQAMLTSFQQSILGHHG